MQQTLLIELQNDAAGRLLQELEALQIIRILEQPAVKPKGRFSDKYVGMFTPEEAASFNEHVRKSREEWPTNF